jgi:hypothetical protein
MSETESSPTTSPAGRRGIWAAFIPLGLVTALTAGYFLTQLPSLWGRHLAACDEAIKETLKAPSTYKRIESYSIEGQYSSSYVITYDAQNSFGVPLRGKAHAKLATAPERSFDGPIMQFIQRIEGLSCWILGDL